MAARPGWRRRRRGRPAAGKKEVAHHWIVLPQRVSSGRRRGQPEPPARFFPDWLMTAFELIEIDEMVAACNGGGGPLGHPRVYLNLAPAGRVECPYCSRLFVNRAMAGRVPPEIGVVMPSAHQPGAP